MLKHLKQISTVVVVQDDAGNTHLHKAVLGLEDQPELVAALLTVGVPGNAVNKEGDTALHIAARAGHIRVSARSMSQYCSKLEVQQ